MAPSTSSLAIGLDIGGTDTKAVVIDKSGAVVHQSSEPTALPGQKTEKDVVARLNDRINRLRAEDTGPIERLGVAIPGMASRDERSAAWLPAGKLSLQGVDLADAFRWSSAVPVLNDAHAALLGEVWRGAAVGKEDVVLLTLGTGVGGAILAGGRLIRGAIGRAGHLGHIGIGTDSPPSVCGMPGSLEESIGNVSLARRTNGRFSSTSALLAAVKSGDADADRVWDKSVRDLAYAIASFINMLDPEIIVITGGIAKAGDELFGRLPRHLVPIEWKPTNISVPIVPATLGEWAGAIGAASRAFGLTG